MSDWTLMHLFVPGVPGGAPLRAVPCGTWQRADVRPGRAMAWAVLLIAPLLAWGNPVSTEHVTARLLAEHDPAVPGQPLELLLSLEIRPGWHTYWRNPGDSGEAPGIDWTLPQGVRAGPLQFPAPALIRVGPLANFGYSGRALHPVRLSIPADWPIGKPIPVRARAHWLVCEEHCVPESAVLELTLRTAATAGPSDPQAATAFAQARAGLPVGTLAGAVLVQSPGGLRLSLPSAGLGPAPSAVRFFPWSWGLIEPAADQPWRLAGDRLELDLSPGEVAATADPGGLLSVQGADGSGRSFEVNATRGTPDQAVYQAAPAAAPTLGLPLALAFAFLGGLILNLMPCVFPVLAIKALSLAGQGGLGARERIAHGLAYTAGVLVFFAGLTAILLAARAGGTAVGWGFQLQYPPFVAIMADVFLVLGLSLAGAVTLGGRLMGLAGGRAGRGVIGAFGTGALAALVAAPCTAPFMGVALGYALTLAWPLALTVLLALGLGLAAPFLALSLAPGLARRLPRPGAWMEHLKQLLAFPMFATAAWLVWVLSVQTGPAGVARVLAGLLALSFGLWARERTAMARRGWPLAGDAAALAGLAVALWLGFVIAGASAPVAQAGDPAAQAGLPAQPYSPERLAQARAQGRPVFVNMTAAWCITCLVNERVALTATGVVAAFRAADVLYLKGDWTHRDQGIGAYLAGFGRNGVPLYVYYPPGGEPRVLPQLLTPGMVRQALGSAPADPR
ncbi:thioredoxin family protein [uncultured Thiodictyon sp.]|uniref:protein-disulfide reductase DsbD family protein n=1 Tax=uncultured Thiodictyon sp. TaxID=1846217 RepID=UPI0025EC81E0|nr:thioredoxin family protein [uncultured Thiodictyon sp.]